MYCDTSPYTVNDKSFEGEKFRGLLGSSGMRGKVSRFFSITTFIHSWFSNSTKQLQVFQESYECFNESFAFLTWILLKTVISILRNGREYITDMCMQISRFPGWPCSHRRRATVEVSSRWKRSLTTSLLASSASYFLISWQKPSRFFATTME